jgi:enoyl-CoA hydratase/carnithine racemase
MTSTLRIERDGAVARVWLDRPEVRNALNGTLIRELAATFGALAVEPDVRAIVLGGSGKAFCAGADLAEAQRVTADPAAFRAWATSWRDAFGALETLDKPVIAAVQGVALAGGLELVLACDVVIASSAARFGDVHIRSGLVPGGGGSQRLPEAIGTRRARWLMYSGEIIDAAEAERIGLVQHVLPAEDFHETALDLATAIANRSAPALAFMKQLSRPKHVTQDGLDHEIEAAVGVVIGADAQEGIDAFLNKRTPHFPSVR